MQIACVMCDPGSYHLRMSIRLQYVSRCTLMPISVWSCSFCRQSLLPLESKSSTNNFLRLWPCLSHQTLVKASPKHKSRWLRCDMWKSMPSPGETSACLFGHGAFELPGSADTRWGKRFAVPDGTLRITTMACLGRYSPNSSHLGCRRYH